MADFNEFESSFGAEPISGQDRLDLESKFGARVIGEDEYSDFESEFGAEVDRSPVGILDAVNEAARGDFAGAGEALVESDVGQFVKEEVIPFGKEIATGFTGVQAPKPSEEGFDFIRKSVPRSAGALVGGVLGFGEEIGRTVFDTAKAVTDPIYFAATGEFKKSMGSLRDDIPKIADRLNNMAKGLIELGTLPVGINPFPEGEEDFISWQNMVDNYGARPIETVVGGLMALHARSRAKDVTPDITKKGRALDERAFEEIEAAKPREGVTPREPGEIAVEGPIGIPEVEAKVRDISDVVKEVEKPVDPIEVQAKIDELKTSMEKVKEETGADVKAVYDPVLEKILEEAPVETKVEIEKARVETPAKPKVSIGPDAPPGAASVPDALIDVNMLNKNPGLYKADNKLFTPEALKRADEIRKEMTTVVEPPTVQPVSAPKPKPEKKLPVKEAIKQKRISEEQKVEELLFAEQKIAEEAIPKRKPLEGPTDAELRAIEEETGEVVREPIAEIKVEEGTVRAEQSRAAAHNAAIANMDLVGAKLVSKKFLDFARDLPTPDELTKYRIAQVYKKMLADEKYLEANPPKPKRAAQKRQLEESLFKEGRENLDLQAIEALNEMGLLDEINFEHKNRRIKNEELKTQKEIEDSTLADYFRSKLTDPKADPIDHVNKLTEAGRKNILEEIRKDPELYEEINGDVKSRPTDSYLGGDTPNLEMLGLQSVYEFGKKKFKDVRFNHITGPLRALKDTYGIDVLPRISRFSNEVTDAAVEHASVKASTMAISKSMLSEALPNIYKDPVKLSFYKDLMNKDNILDGYDAFIKKAEVAKGDNAKLQWYEAARKVSDKHDIAAYDAEVRTALSDSTIVRDMSRIKDVTNGFMDKLYREIKDIDPNTELDGRGKYFGVRTNLVTKELGGKWKEFIESNEGATPEFPRAGNYRNPNVKHDPFDMSAKFTGEYSTDFEASLNAVLGKRLNEVTKLRFYEQMISDGIAREVKTGSKGPTALHAIVDGKVKKFDVGRIPIKRPVTNEKGVTRQVESQLYVPKEIAREVDAVLDTSMSAPSSRVLRALNRVQLAQAVDAVFHTRNLVLGVNRAKQFEAGWKGVQNRVPGFGAAKSVASIMKTAAEISKDGPAIRKELAEMSQIGSVRTEYPHHITPGFIRKFVKESLSKSDIKIFNKLAEKAGDYTIGKAIYKIDTAGRVILNRHYNDLVKRGLKEDTVASRRKFNDQLGQYNRRLMGHYMRAARDAGVAPFIVAGRNFFTQGVRSLTGKTGGKAKDRTAELKMRFISTTAIATSFALPAMLNMITTGEPGGRSGTKPGEWDLGTEFDEKGKHRTIDLLQFTFIRRGARAIGANALVQGLYEDHDANTIFGNARDEIKSSLVHPWVGPGARFMLEGTLGVDLGEFKGEEAPLRIPEGGILQNAENFRAAAESINPLLYSMLRPSFQEMGVDKKPEDPEHDTWPTFMKTFESVAGLRDRGSSAYYEMGRMYRNRGIKSAETAENLAIRKLRNSLEGKSDDEYLDILSNAVETGMMDEKRANKIFKNRNLSPLARGFERLSMKTPLWEAKQVWNKTTKEEKLELAPLMETKINNAWNAIPEFDPKKRSEEFINEVEPIVDDMFELIGDTSPPEPPEPEGRKFDDKGAEFTKPQGPDVSVIETLESGGDPNAVSKKGAIGPMQLLKGTFKDFVDAHPDRDIRLSQIRDHEINREAGQWYLSTELPRLLESKGIEPTLLNIVASYNLGPDKLARWVEVNGNVTTDNVDSMRIKETREYVKRYIENTSQL